MKNKYRGLYRISLTVFTGEKQDYELEDIFSKTLHVFEAAEFAEDEFRYIFTSSPEHCGTSWVEGSAESEKGIKEELINLSERRYKRWHGYKINLMSDRYTLIFKKEEPLYSSAEVEFWTAEEQERFYQALSNIGGVARFLGVKKGFDNPILHESSLHESSSKIKLLSMFVTCKEKGEIWIA